MRHLRLVAIIGVLLASCGRTTGTVEIPPEDLPFAVARTASPSASPTSTRIVTVYLVRDNRLVAIRRDSEAEGSGIEAAMRVLLEGPTRAERARGLSSDVPAAVRLLSLGVGDGVAQVDLSGEFQAPAPSEHIALRVAQVVWTLTGFSDIDAVSFAIDGEVVAVTTENGESVTRPVTRSDYRSLGPAGSDSDTEP